MTEQRPIRQAVESSLAERYRSEIRFRRLGFAAIVFAVLCLVFLLGDIVYKGIGGFSAVTLNLEVRYDAESLEIDDLQDPEAWEWADYQAPPREALLALFPEAASSRAERRALYKLLGTGAEVVVRQRLSAEPDLLGESEELTVPASFLVKQYLRAAAPEAVIPDAKLRARLDSLRAEGRIAVGFNWNLFKAGDSRDPETAGIRGAVVGSLFTLAVCLLLTFPVGVAAAIYLEEFAPRNRWTDMVEVNINNLAAVPSIIFGLLGLAIFLNFFGLPRSAPLVGGMVLALMTLPTIIIAGRSAIVSVPPSVREAALGLGASHVQMVFGHVLPLALPGILTGTIIGMARALGETAPLLMIGMVAFIADIPARVTDAATVLPVQVYLWAGSPEQGFLELASAAIMVLVAFLIVMNAAAVLLRRRFEKRW